MPRPKVQHPHEHRIEADIHRARRHRDRAMKLEAPVRARGAALPGPEKFCIGRGPSPMPIPPAVKAWIRREEAQQLANYQAIAQEVADLTPMREQWVKEFFARITGPRGFSVHAGQRRTIRADEVPARPKRPWRVLW